MKSASAGRVSCSEPLIASNCGSNGGMVPDAVPTQTIRPRRLSESSEPMKVFLPTLSNTTFTPTPSVSSRTRVATSSTL
ncbi:hypothetical protein D3C75_1260840 [compost metagenome]